MKIPSAVHNGLLVLSSMLFALFLSEKYYEQIEPETQREDYLKSEFVFFQYDPMLGWKGLPNATGYLQRTENKADVRINSQGMRYHEVTPKNGFRVAVLGDSFTWGNGVEEKDRYTNIIEDELGIDMLNFGVSGYSPVQYYLQLDEVLKYEPDFVILSFFLGNDFTENVQGYRYHHYRPYAAMEDGKLVIKGHPTPLTRSFQDMVRPPLANFALGRMLYATGWLKYDYPPKAPDELPGMWEIRDETMYKRDAPQLKQIADINEALLAAIKEKLDRHHIPMLIFVIPSKRDLTNRWVWKMLADSVHRLEIPAEMDMYRVLSAEKDYYGFDPHWNPKGHMKAAEMLMPLLESRLMEIENQKESH